MKWFQLFKVHTFVNDALESIRIDSNRTTALENRKEADKQEIRTVFEQHAKDTQEVLDSRQRVEKAAFQLAVSKLENLIKDTHSQVGKWLAEQQAVVTEMIGDAEEIRRTVERLHRREAEFTSMIDTRCRGIGEKIREDFVGNIERAADRATQAAAEAKLVSDQAEESFSDKLSAHKRTVDQKLNLMAETVSKAEDAAKLMTLLRDDAMAAVEKRIAEAKRPAAQRY